ncbi:hypothetical protein ACFQ3G_03190, partial [Psychrobacter sanguinis]
KFFTISLNFLSHGKLLFVFFSLPSFCLRFFQHTSVAYMDYDEYMNAVECWGMEKIILPAFVFEAPTKC